MKRISYIFWNTLSAWIFVHLIPRLTQMKVRWPAVGRRKTVKLEFRVPDQGIERDSRGRQSVVDTHCGWWGAGTVGMKVCGGPAWWRGKVSLWLGGGDWWWWIWRWGELSKMRKTVGWGALCRHWLEEDGGEGSFRRRRGEKGSRAGAVDVFQLAIKVEGYRWRLSAACARKRSYGGDGNRDWGERKRCIRIGCCCTNLKAVLRSWIHWILEVFLVKC